MSVFVGGQSLARMFLEHNRGEFAATVAALAPEIAAPRLWGYAIGGTVAASTNVFPPPHVVAQRYWWDMEADAPGELLAHALSVIDAHTAEPAVAMVWDLGQHEAVIARGRMGRAPADVERDFRHATLRCLTSLRDRLRPSQPDSLPILFMCVGPVKAPAWYDMSGMERIRAAQRDIIAAVPNCHEAGDISAMELKDPLHPSAAGSRYYLRVVAETFVRVMRADQPTFRRASSVVTIRHSTGASAVTAPAMVCTSDSVAMPAPVMRLPAIETP